MSEKVREPESWKEVIVSFFENKMASSSLYKAREYIEKKDKEIQSEKDVKKQGNLLKARDKKAIELADLRKKALSGEIRDWVVKITDKKNKRAPIRETDKISKATHILKFTHSSSSAGGVVLTEKSDDKLLSTSSIKKPLTLDFSHNDGILISISRFLALIISEKPIFDLVSEDDFSFFDGIAKNEEELKNWKNVFSNLVEGSELKTADKAKQIYFPLSHEIKLDDEGAADNKNYHLVIPLFSSSLAEEIYALQIDLKYGEEQHLVRQAKNGGVNDFGPKSRYHLKHLIELPGLAVQKFGGANSQNVSMLNKGRSWKANKKDKTTYGVTYLFKAAPPPSAWQSQLKPPINQKTVFGRGFYLPGSTDSINYLREFLLRFERVDLSIKNPKRIKWIESWVGEIVTEFLAYVVGIQKLPAGWSKTKGIKLKLEHQYLLDPFREWDAYQAPSKASDWQTVICNDFGWWLNNRLRGKDKKFTPQPEHRSLWAKLLEKPLRDHHEMVAVELKRRAGGTV